MSNLTTHMNSDLLLSFYRAGCQICFSIIFFFYSKKVTVIFSHQHGTKWCPNSAVLMFHVSMSDLSPRQPLPLGALVLLHSAHYRILFTQAEISWTTFGNCWIINYILKQGHFVKLTFKFSVRLGQRKLIFWKQAPADTGQTMRGTECIGSAVSIMALCPWPAWLLFFKIK